MILDSQSSQALGTNGQKLLSKGPNGVDVYGPDDSGVGSGTFQGAYTQSKGNLATLQNAGSNIINGLNVLGDSHASPGEKTLAAAELVGVVEGVAAAGLYGAQIAGLITAAEVTATVPVVGYVAAAYFVAVAVIIAAFDAILGRKDAPIKTLVEQTLDTIPPRMQFKVVSLYPNGIHAAYLAYQAVAIKIRQIETAANPLSPTPDVSVDRELGDWLLRLSSVLGSDRGRADTLYDIVSKVLLDPRWRLPRNAGLGGMDGVVYPIRGGEGSGIINSGYTYDQLAARWKNSFPSQPELVADQSIVNGSAPVPLLNQNQSPAAYLILYAAAAVAQGFREPAAFAYTALYQLLLARAWTYTSASAPVPDEEFACQGFILDLLSQTPMIRVIRSTNNLEKGKGTVVPGQLERGVYLIKDLTYYVNYYLNLPPAPPSAKPPVVQPNVKPQLNRVAGLGYRRNF